MSIDRKIYQFLKTTIIREKGLQLPANGDSMYPLIHQGDICQFSPFTPSTLKKGDILLFYTEKGELIAHRFYRTKQNYYVTKGDTNLGYDEPIEEKQIVGKLVSVQKKRIMFRQRNLFAILWGKMVQAFPLISGFLRKYLNSKKRIQLK